LRNFEISKLAALGRLFLLQEPMADVLFFVIDQGANWPTQLVLQNDNGTPLNLTGCQVRLQIRPFPGSSTLLLDLSTQDGSITVKPLLGQINWDVPVSETETFTQTKGITVPPVFGSNCVAFGSYDLLVEWPNGQVTRYLCGQVALSPATTVTD
jgi:hypothetical protein